MKPKTIDDLIHADDDSNGNCANGSCTVPATTEPPVFRRITRPLPDAGDDDDNASPGTVGDRT